MSAQVTVREWFRLPKTERRDRIAEFKEADEALQANSQAEYEANGRNPVEESDRYHELNGRVNDLWPTVPWWWRR